MVVASDPVGACCPELFHLIVQHLELHELGALQLVSRRWRQLLRRSRVWKAAFRASIADPGLKWRLTMQDERARAAPGAAPAVDWRRECLRLLALERNWDAGACKVRLVRDPTAIHGGLGRLVSLDSADGTLMCNTGRFTPAGAEFSLFARDSLALAATVTARRAPDGNGDWGLLVLPHSFAGHALYHQDEDRTVWLSRSACARFRIPRPGCDHGSPVPGFVRLFRFPAVFNDCQIGWHVDGAETERPTLVAAYWEHCQLVVRSFGKTTLVERFDFTAKLVKGNPLPSWVALDDHYALVNFHPGRTLVFSRRTKRLLLTFPLDSSQEKGPWASVSFRLALGHGAAPPSPPLSPGLSQCQETCAQRVTLLGSVPGEDDFEETCPSWYRPRSCGFTNTDLVLTNDDGRVLIVRNYDEAFRMAAAAPEQERTGIVAQHTLNLDPSVLWDVHEVVARNDRILSLVKDKIGILDRLSLPKMPLQCVDPMSSRFARPVLRPLVIDSHGSRFGSTLLDDTAIYETVCPLDGGGASKGEYAFRVISFEP